MPKKYIKNQAADYVFGIVGGFLRSVCFMQNVGITVNRHSIGFKTENFFENEG
jgi:hypothetical protein